MKTQEYLNQNNPRNPVLMIHGIYDTVAQFKRMSDYLTQLGWEVHCINLKPNTGWKRLDQLAQQVREYTEKTFPKEQAIDLIGFSMGGIVTRYYLQRLGGIKRVKRYITISAPNQGTWLAYSLPLPGIMQMGPNSQFLQDLNQDCHELLNEIDVTILWTPFDLMILPPESSKMPIGQEIQLPVLNHRWMISDRRCLEIVADTLLKPLKNSNPATLKTSTSPLRGSQISSPIFGRGNRQQATSNSKNVD